MPPSDGGVGNARSCSRPRVRSPAIAGVRGRDAADHAAEIGVTIKLPYRYSGVAHRSPDGVRSAGAASLVDGLPADMRHCGFRWLPRPSDGGSLRISFDRGLFGLSQSNEVSTP